MFIVEKPLSKGGLANTTNAHDCCNFNAASETCCACLVMQMDQYEHILALFAVLVLEAAAGVV